MSVPGVKKRSDSWRMVSAGRILLLVMASDASKLFYLPGHLWCFLWLAMFKNSTFLLSILFYPFLLLLLSFTEYACIHYLHLYYNTYDVLWYTIQSDLGAKWALHLQNQSNHMARTLWIYANTHTPYYPYILFSLVIILVAHCCRVFILGTILTC